MRDVLSTERRATMTIAGIPIEIQKKSIKNIHIHVKAPKGNVIVTAPRQTNDATIIKIVEERIEWIKRQQVQMAKRMKLRVNQEVDKTDWVAADKSLRANISKLLPKWESITKLKCSTWQIRKMKTRWGSCNVKTKKIWFNLHLANTTIGCLEYIILHELLHIRVPNHGAQFKAQMDHYMPNWREIQKELKQYILD